VGLSNLPRASAILATFKTEFDLSLDSMASPVRPSRDIHWRSAPPGLPTLALVFFFFWLVQSCSKPSVQVGRLCPLVFPPLAPRLRTLHQLLSPEDSRSGWTLPPPRSLILFPPAHFHSLTHQLCRPRLYHSPFRFPPLPTPTGPALFSYVTLNSFPAVRSRSPPLCPGPPPLVDGFLLRSSPLLKVI